MKVVKFKAVAQIEVKCAFALCFLHLFVIARSEYKNCKLKERTLSCWGISKFPVNSNGSNIEILNLAYKDNTLVRLSDGDLLAGNFTQLQMLELNENKIRWIENGFFRGGYTLRSVDLGNNGISELDLNIFKDLLSLRSLYLYHNQVKLNVHNSTFPLLTNLTYLSLSNCRMSLKPNLFKNLTNLKYLNLNGNEVRSLNDEIFSTLANLEKLDLGNNQLKLISPSYFANLRNLENLILNNNPITDIQTGSWNNPNLKKVDLFFCKLRFLQQKMFIGLNNLQEVTFGSDMLEFTENNVFAGQKNLTKMDARIQFRKVPSAWDWIKNLVYLTSLNLESSQMTYVKSKLFTNLLNLQKIDLSSNSFYLFDPVVFAEASNLEEINLSYNRRIEFVRESSFPNLKLKTLKLNSCNLRSLEPTLFKNLGNLTTLYLNNNKFKTLDWRAIQPVANTLQEIKLYSNELKCDCHLGFFLSLFKPDVEVKWTFLRNSDYHACSTVDELVGPSGSTLVGKNSLSLNDRNQMICSPKIYTLRYKIETAKTGKCVTLQCDYMGYPSAEVNWLRNGKLLSKMDISSDEEDEFRYEFSHQFTIENFTEEDSGRYDCLISIGGRNASKSITLEYANLQNEMESETANEIFFFKEPRYLGDFYKANVQNYCQNSLVEQRGMTESVRATSCVILFSTENCDDTGGRIMKVKPNQSGNPPVFQDVILSFQSCESYYKSQEKQDEPKPKTAEEESLTGSTSHVGLNTDKNNEDDVNAICPLCPDLPSNRTCPRLPEIPACPDCNCPAYPTCPPCILNEISSTSQKGQNAPPVNKFIWHGLEFMLEQACGIDQKHPLCVCRRNDSFLKTWVPPAFD